MSTPQRPPDDRATLAEVLHRLHLLEQRLSRLEDRAGLGLSKAAPDVPAAPSAVPPVIAQPPPRPTPPTQAPRPSEPTHPPTAPPVVAPPTPQSPARPAADGQSAPPRSAKPAFNLEWIIGTRGLAAAGAIAVVAGVIFFLRYAVEQGWIGHIPPLARCLCGVAFGGLLIGVGEAARRRINALAAAGLYAAGLACAYASVYAGYGYFSPPVISQPVAFAALALISALGIALSATTRIASVAIVSLIGAYLAPFLLRTADPNPLVFPIYAGTLLATGLSLAAWMRGSFRWVGRAVWWATMLIGGWWAVATLDHHPVIVILFAAAVWGMIHTSHIIAARGQVVRDEDRDRPPTPAPLAAGSPMLSSFSVTGWTGVLLTLSLRAINPSLDWLAPCGITGITGVLAIWLAGHLGVVRNRPRTDAERLGASLALQSAAALIGAVALATSSSGPAASLLWLCMGVGAIAAGRWGRVPAAIVYGTVLLTIGVGRLTLWDSWNSALFSPAVDALGVLLTPWTAWMTLAAAAWLGAGTIVSLGAPPARRSIYGSVLAGFGVLILCASLINIDSDPLALTYTFIALPMLVIAFHYRRPQLSLNWVGGALLVLVSLKVAAADAVLSATPPAAPRFLGLPLTPSIGLCCALCLAWGTLALLARARIDRSPRWLIAATAFSVTALAVLLLAPIKRDAEPTQLVWPWAVVAGVAAAISRLEPRLKLRPTALVVCFLSGLAWLSGFALLTRFARWSLEPAPFTHPGLLTAAVAAVAALLIAAAARPRGAERGAQPHLTTAAFTLAAVLFWLAVSFEADRVADAVTGSPDAGGPTVSIWWGVFAVGLLLVGFRRSLAWVRYAGLAMLAVAGLKVVVIDMADAPQLARVAGFVTLGLLMLGTAVGYARVNKTLDRGKPPENA